MMHREKLDDELDYRFLRGQGDQVIGKCLNQNCQCRFPQVEKERVGDGWLSLVCSDHHKLIRSRSK
jgi:hypothetical protein